MASQFHQRIFFCNLKIFVKFSSPLFVSDAFLHHIELGPMNLLKMIIIMIIIIITE